MLRILIALVAGLVVAVVVIMSVEGLGNQLYPPPRGVDLNSSSALSWPVQTLIWPVLGWFLGTLGGGYLALRLGRRNWLPWAIAGAVLLATVATFAMITHPLWMMVAGALAPLLGAWLAQQVAGRAGLRPASE